jgi:hypothetical protein
MPRRTRRVEATRTEILECLQQHCPYCGRLMWNAYDNHHTVSGLEEVVHLQLKVRWCVNRMCKGYQVPYRPEEEGRWALPHHEFGLDVIAQIGAWRYQEHRTVPEIHQRLSQRGVAISERSVTNQLERYDELVTLSLRQCSQLQQRLIEQGRVILAVDGLQPDVGHEVLWVIRDCLSGEILLARALLTAAQDDLAGLLQEVVTALPVPVAGIVSDGQQSIRKAVAKALPGVAHGLCHFHYLREAVRPLYEADRHAKKELKKLVRGIRPLERQVEEREDPTGVAIQGYCQAVRSALTDDGRAPLDAAGLRLRERLSQISASLARAEKKRCSPQNCGN